MSDERMDAEQVLAQAVAPHVETVGDAVDAAGAGLAALRAYGFEVYRPEDSFAAEVTIDGLAWRGDVLPFGTYRLVPISGETPKESVT